MTPKIASTFRVATVVSLVAAVLWVVLIGAPMWLTRWRMSQLLADYHNIFPMQSNWSDAQRLMTRWGNWGRYEGACNTTDCEYFIRIDDPYVNLTGELPYHTIEQVWGSAIWHGIWQSLGRLGYRSSAFMVLFQVQDGKIVRTYTMMHIDVVDAGPPEHWSYVLGVSAQVRSRLASITRNGNSDSPRVLGNDDQLALHPDYKVGRPSGCEVCEIDHITYAPTMPHDEAVRLTNFNLDCLTRLHACTKIGELLPEGAGWHLYEDSPSTLYPAANGNPLPCRTEARALGRDAATILEVEVLDTLPDFHADPSYESSREFVRVRVIQEWKKPIHSLPGSTTQVTPFSGEKANPPYWPARAAEHLLVKHRALIFLTEDAETNFSSDPAKIGVAAYSLGPCGVIADTPSNLAGVQIGVAQDAPYRHPLHDIHWW